MGNRRVCQHAFKVGLRNRNDIAHRQRRDRECHQHLRPVDLQIAKAIDQQANGHRKPAILGAVPMNSVTEVGEPW